MLKLQVKDAGKYDVIVQLTKANAYGIIQMYLDGEKLGDPVDCYNTEVGLVGGFLLCFIMFTQELSWRDPVYSFRIHSTGLLLHFQSIILLDTGNMETAGEAAASLSVSCAFFLNTAYQPEERL